MNFKKNHFFCCKSKIYLYICHMKFFWISQIKFCNQLNMNALKSVQVIENHRKEVMPTEIPSAIDYVPISRMTFLLSWNLFILKYIAYVTSKCNFPRFSVNRCRERRIIGVSKRVLNIFCSINQILYEAEYYKNRSSRHSRRGNGIYQRPFQKRGESEKPYE